MESRLISLVFDLEKNNPLTYARPFPGAFVNLHDQIEKEEKNKQNGKGKGTRNTFLYSKFPILTYYYYYYYYSFCRQATAAGQADEGDARTPKQFPVPGDLLRRSAEAAGCGRVREGRGRGRVPADARAERTDGGLQEPVRRLARQAHWQHRHGHPCQAVTPPLLFIIYLIFRLIFVWGVF
jgi:hypothetical protein